MISRGYMADKPLEAARTLVRCIDPRVRRDDRSEAFSIVRAYIQASDKETFWLQRFEWAAHSVGNGLEDRLWSDGRVDEAYRVGQIVGVPDNYGDHVLRRGLYRLYNDFGRAPLRMFARAGNYRIGSDPDRFVEVYRRYPRSRIAPVALLRAARLLEYPPESLPKARELRQLVVERFPDSPEAMLCRAEIAAEEFRFGEAEGLCSKLERRSRAKDGAEVDVVSDQIGSLLHSRIPTLRTLRAILEPVLRPAGREDLLRSSGRLHDVWRLWEVLAGEAPGLAAEIRLAFARHPNYASASGDFLRCHPDYPAAGEVWRSLPSYGVWTDPGKPLTDALGWLVELVNREPAYSHRAEADAALDQGLSVEGPITVGARCRAVAEAWPQSRAHKLANLVEARDLIIRDRPEAALRVLARLDGEAALERTLQMRAGFLRACAERTTAAKRLLPLWRPAERTKGAEPDSSSQEQTPWQPPQKEDDLAMLVRCAGEANAPRATFRGVVYACAQQGLLRAVDLETGARLGVAWTGMERPSVVTADEDGVRLIDGVGVTVVLPLR